MRRGLEMNKTQSHSMWVVLQMESEPLKGQHAAVAKTQEMFVPLSKLHTANGCMEGDHVVEGVTSCQWKPESSKNFRSTLIQML